MSLAIILLVAALVCGILALIGVSSRIDLTATGLVLLCVYLLAGSVG